VPDGTPSNEVNVPTSTAFYSLDVASNTCQLALLSNTPLLIGVGLLLVFGMTVMGGGAPRRYGR